MANRPTCCKPFSIRANNRLNSGCAEVAEIFRHAKLLRKIITTIPAAPRFTRSTFTVQRAFRDPANFPNLNQSNKKQEFL